MTNTTTGQEITLATTPTISAENMLWLESSAQTGTVNELNVTIFFREDVQI